jgi:putative tryptophan/tyrosine transport system substrate-binding protein
MKRREFITLLGGAAAAPWPLAARAQQQAMPLIGVLSPSSVVGAARNIKAFRQGLRDLGYVEGQNVAIEYRFAEGVLERLTSLTLELVALNSSVIVVGSTSGIVSARTQTVPLITIGTTDDPVRLGLAENFARPGKNVTGFLLVADQEIVGKRLQLLRDAAPGISRVGIIVNPDSPGDAAEVRILPSVAGRIGLQYRVFEVRKEAELEPTFATIARDGLQALYLSWNPLFNVHRATVTFNASKLRLPTIYGFREFVQSGGLMSYGPDLPDQYRRAAAYVDRILKGARAAELPLQVAAKYELVINLKTANTLGLKISPTLLALADGVGGLMSYGPDLPDQYRRAAAYVDRILKGARAAELPLQVAVIE